VTTTLTASRTNTFTEPRLRAVMPEVGADFYALASASIISFDTAVRWTEELTFILQHQAARGFQIQLTYPSGHKIALDYRVSSDGSIRESSTGGGIDYYLLPAGTSGVLFVDLDETARGIQTVRTYIRERAWGTGNAVEGDPVRDRAYSKDGYGVIRGKIGAWPV
jgi:Bacterial HORMA domain family 1